jgi:hypothetical protein
LKLALAVQQERRAQVVTLAAAVQFLAALHQQVAENLET